MYLKYNGEKIALAELRGQPANKSVSITVTEQPPEEDIGSLVEDLNKFSSVFIEISHTPKGVPAGMAICNLEYLTRIRQLKGLYLNFAFGQKDFGFLNKLESLESLHVSGIKTKVSLKKIVNCKKLKELKIEKMAKDLSILSNIQKLQYIHLHTINMPSADFISCMKNLKKIDLVNLRLDSLDGFESQTAEELRVWDLRIDNDNNLTYLSKFPNLNCLEIFEISKVSSISDISFLKKLRSVSLRGMPNLESIDFLKGVQSLEELWVSDCPQLSAQSFHVLSDLPKLKYGAITLGQREGEIIRGFINLENPLIKKV